MSPKPSRQCSAWLASIAWAAVCGAAWVAESAAAEEAAFGNVEIAPAEEALTFARVGGGVILVEEYRDGIVKGRNLTCALGRVVADPIDVFRAEGYGRLLALLSRRDPDCTLVSKVEDLNVPVDLRDRNIAAGTNFPEHAGEAEVEDGPFLFAKLVEPTAFDAPVPAGDGLLDYEAELAWVPLEPIEKGENPRWMGLILANDYTDRAALLRNIDPSDVASAKGFTTGKSFPGFLPVGDLFVVPADFRAFAPQIELRLYVNGQLMQRAMVSEAIWDFDEMLDQIWQWQDRRWAHQGGEVTLLDQPDLIESRTMLLGGTPSGTLFQGVPDSARVSGVLSWLAGGWSRPVADHVIDHYIASARSAGQFLEAGDRVVMHVDRLGVVDNRVETADGSAR